MDYINQIIQGDCKEKLKLLPDKSVRCCVTSPPYFGLRDYGTATWEGGDASCDHKGAPMRTKANINKNCGTGDDVKNGEDNEFFKNSCAKCGAKRIDDQIGLEETPEQYIANLVGVFEEVKRVLTDDGTLWINIGDSYASMAGGYDLTGSRGANAVISKNTQAAVLSRKKRRPYEGIKQKDLIGIPWMLAFALRAAGWYLRQDIIWAKPNPMPESVTDRCTKSHEYIFLLSKSMRYYYDAESIRQEMPESSIKRLSQNIDSQSGSNRVPGKTNGPMKAVSRKRGHVRPHNGFNNKWDSMTKEEQHAAGANKRSVWTVTTKPYSEAHFATFPPELIVDCIKAGSEEGDIVLDPFSGAGTTAMVAKKLNRNFVVIELNPKYINISKRRLHKELGVFKDVIAQRNTVERSVATDVK